MRKEKYVLGVDYGTDSCRALLVNGVTGEEIASAVSCYKRWKEGKYCDSGSNQYRQHPLDYVESLEEVIQAVLAQSPQGTAKCVVGISFDTTGSTPVLLDRYGTPLSLLPEYAENPNGMFILWKDHTAIREAGEINALSKNWETDYTAYSGGIYSSEWVWSKMLHILREDESIRDKAYSWGEHCDWMPALLTGKTKPEEMIRSRCAAGHKAMWNEKWGGLPSIEFLHTLDPVLDVFNNHLYNATYTCDYPVGYLMAEWANRLGLHTGVVVGVGALDCHMGAIGAQITPGTFLRVMGTSTCDVMVSSYEEMQDRLIQGICGQVDGSVLPGMIGLEAGQSAFGDVYAWFKKVLLWPLDHLLPRVGNSVNAQEKEALYDEIAHSVLYELSLAAAQIEPSKSSLVAIDWLNGRRTPEANQAVKGSIYGLTLGTTAPLLYRALVEATAYGSRAIVDCMLEQGVSIDSVTAIGGISLKSPFVMQTLSDVLGMPIKVAKAEQACALGAAMCASVAAGIWPTIQQAQEAMGKGFSGEYKPDINKQVLYDKQYRKYKTLSRFTEEAFT